MAALEGPIVAIVSGYLSRAGLLILSQALVVAVLADQLGDVGQYMIGRRGRAGVALPELPN
jgi:membrane protein DedA with SNARE-associated domain